MRHFHQPIEYWLDNCTLQDARGIYLRELIESPPVERFLAGYFKYEASSSESEAAEDDEVAIELPEFEA